MIFVLSFFKRIAVSFGNHQSLLRGYSNDRLSIEATPIFEMTAVAILVTVVALGCFVHCQEAGYNDPKPGYYNGVYVRADCLPVTSRYYEGNGLNPGVGCPNVQFPGYPSRTNNNNNNGRRPNNYGRRPQYPAQPQQYNPGYGR